MDFMASQDIIILLMLMMMPCGVFYIMLHNLLGLIWAVLVM